MNGMQNVTIITRVRGNELDDTIKLGGQTMQTVHAVFSQDGQIVTVKRDGKDRQGQPLHNIEIY